MSLANMIYNIVLNHPWQSIFAFILSLVFYKEYRFNQTLAKDIPVVGAPFPGWIGSWLGGLAFILNGHNTIFYGYAKHDIFQVPLYDRMLIVVKKPNYIDELCNADPNRLSFLESIDADFQAEYTISTPVKERLWHIPIISDRLTRRVMTSIIEMREEIPIAFDAVFNVPKEGWAAVRVHNNALRVFARLINRFFVGVPLCRDEDYIQNCVAYAKAVAMSGFFIRPWPNWMKPFIARLVNQMPAIRKKAMEYLEPIVRQRNDKFELLGDKWSDRPNDYLQWLIEGAKVQPNFPYDTVDIILRMLFMNFAAVHTSGEMFCIALYEMIRRPEYMDPLREEAEAMIEKYGYTPLAFSKMSKMDSFTRECSRYVSLGSIVATRKTMVPYTFADGLRVPEGSYICTPHHAVHNDEKHYPGGAEFDGFRFHKYRQELAEKDPNSKKYEKAGLWTSTTSKQLFFGYGRHACPGRFIASLQSKMVFHYLLTTYDMKFVDGGWKPNPHRVHTMYMPNLLTKVMFRRKTVASSV